MVSIGFDWHEKSLDHGLAERKKTYATRGYEIEVRVAGRDVAGRCFGAVEC